jgi:hypothetical protein
MIYILYGYRFQRTTAQTRSQYLSSLDTNGRRYVTNQEKATIRAATVLMTGTVIRRRAQK